MGDLHQRKILSADIEDFVLDLFRRRGQEHFYHVAVILDVEVWPQLRTAENGNLVSVHSMIGENIHGQVEALAGRVSADRRWPEDNADKFVVGVLAQQRLAHALIFVVKRKRYQ